MKLAKFLKAAFVTGVVTACVSGLVACGGGSGSTAGGVAAMVNGTPIEEDLVTNYIQNYRQQAGLEEEEAWAQNLITIDSTPESIREQVIEQFEEIELLNQGAQELGVSIDSTEIDTYVESLKANYESDEAFDEALSQAGYTLDSYRENIETSLVQQRVSQHFNDEATVDDDDVLEVAKSYASVYSGAKRSSHILIGVDDTSDEDAMAAAREKAKEIKDRIDSGELDFEDAVKEYSTDTGSAENGGDVGWDATSSFVSEYTDALENLDEGEISDPVDSQFGVHIIKVTEVYEAPDEVKSLSDLPEEFHSRIEDAAKSTKASEDYNAWIEELKEKADIVVNPMPENVPYNVDLTKYQDESDAEGDEAEDSDSADAEDADAEAADEAASDEAASDEAASDEAASDEAASDESAEAEASDASAESSEASEGAE